MLKEDADCGKRTIAAIKHYQRNFLQSPDGRIDVGGSTWKRLLEGKFKVKSDSSNTLVLLPQVSALGYYSYASKDRQYGTASCIQTLRDVAGQFRHNMPDVEIGIGDISFAAGGYMSPHQSHQHGRHIDIRPLRKDKRRMPVTISDANYSREYTKLLVQALLAHRNVSAILFNDSAISGVKRWAGHDNHLHVTVRE
jgi:murein endopeptidase